MTITQQQILSMLKLQDEMNSIVNPDWRNAGYSWSRAIMVEAVEAIEHHGWKWWKKQSPDMPQVQMEMVDIWHFALSLMMQNTAPGDVEGLRHIAKDIAGKLEYATDTQFTGGRLRLHQIMINGRIRDSDSDTTLPDDLQTIAGMAAGDAFSVVVFSHALGKTGMSWQDLYVAYIGKNCLNRFRQTHGYKTGEYLKDWSAVPMIYPLAEARALEDNDHLHDILRTIDAAAPGLFGLLIQELESRYRTVRGRHAI